MTEQAEPALRPRPFGPRIARGAAAAEAFVMLWALGSGVHVLRQGYARSTAEPTTVAGLMLDNEAVGAMDPDALSIAVDDILERRLGAPLTLAAAHVEVVSTARTVGALAVPQATRAAILRIGHGEAALANVRERIAAAAGRISVPVGFRFDEARARAKLDELAPEVERPSLPTRLDFENRQVLAAQRGIALLPHDSLSAVAVGLASGAARLELSVEQKPAVADPLASLGPSLDISTVIGTFETPYSMDPGEADRNHNLKLGAAAISGTVLRPGDVFSFNQTVGDRSDEAGYRYATGISSGQLIDVLGGGICQVSSTLYGAFFFAGLELLQARPHSRPSGYVDMGLDSTVVWDSVDMKVRNGFDFPVVLHMTVSQGKVRAEVLGPTRPYRVAFEREIVEVLPYETVWRPDDRLRTGTEAVAQRGLRGFRLKRYRKLFRGGELFKTDEWDLYYPATTEIVRRGTNPSGEQPPPQPDLVRRDPPATLRKVQ